jgi:putative transposase
MARENRLWGAERIRGELLKQGVKVSKRTIQKYIPKDRQSRSGQTWSTFLKNHFRDIWFRPYQRLIIWEYLFIAQRRSR